VGVKSSPARETTSQRRVIRESSNAGEGLILLGNFFAMYCDFSLQSPPGTHTGTGHEGHPRLPRSTLSTAYRLDIKVFKS
jgi:hypothetical protein